MAFIKKFYTKTQYWLKIPFVIFVDYEFSNEHSVSLNDIESKCSCSTLVR